MNNNFHLKSAIALADLLDSRFKIFNLKVGLDPLIGLIPWIGDAISVVLALYIVWVAKMHKLPPEKIAQMMGNIMLDFFLGLIPVVGDVGDFFYKSNTRNIEILKKHISEMGKDIN